MRNFGGWIEKLFRKEGVKFETEGKCIIASEGMDGLAKLWLLSGL